MNNPDTAIPEEMNWVDYCDALSNEQFFLRAPASKPAVITDSSPEHAAFIATLHDMSREFT